MSTSKALRDIFNAARPLIGEWLDVGEQIAALRDTATAAGLDWSAVKALIKAQIQDERDNNEGKRVTRILEKAEFASSYADMLGFAKMNEKNFIAEPQTAEPSAPHSAPAAAPEDVTTLSVSEATQSTEQPTAAAEVTTPERTLADRRGAPESASAASPPANAEAVAKKVEQSGQEAAVELPVDTTDTRTNVQKRMDLVNADRAAKKSWKHSDTPHRDCLDPSQCGGLSNLGLCERCKAAQGAAA